MPPRSRSTNDDFAPGGSERTRSGVGRPDTFPPGRRNQPSARPVDPQSNVEGALARLAQVGGTEETATQRRARRRAERAAEGTLVPPQPDPIQAAIDDGDDIAREFYREMPPDDPRQDDVLALALEAVMIGMKLRLLGDSDVTGDWADFDEAAERALAAAAPVDPFDEMPDVVRFVWGMSGMRRMPEGDLEQEDVRDILALGARSTEIAEGGER